MEFENDRNLIIYYPINCDYLFSCIFLKMLFERKLLISYFIWNGSNDLIKKAAFQPSTE